MERYVYSELSDWVKKQRRKPLLLRGARQVGKTWLVEKLAGEQFELFLKVDFDSLFSGSVSYSFDILAVHASSEKMTC